LAIAADEEPLELRCGVHAVDDELRAVAPVTDAGVGIER